MIELLIMYAYTFRSYVYELMNHLMFDIIETSLKLPDEEGKPAKRIEGLT